MGEDPRNVHDLFRRVSPCHIRIASGASKPIPSLLNGIVCKDKKEIDGMIKRASLWVVSVSHDFHALSEPVLHQSSP